MSGVGEGLWLRNPNASGVSINIKSADNLYTRSRITYEVMTTNYTSILNPPPRTRNDRLLRPTFQNVSAWDEKKLFAIDRFPFTFAIMRPVSCDFCTVKSFAYFDTHFGMSRCSTALSLSLACPVHLSIRSLQNFDVTLQ